MRRILLVLAIAAMMVLMATVTAGAAFAGPVCPFCPNLAANDQAQGGWTTGAFAAEDTPAHDLGIRTSFMNNATP